ncbi:4-hydroxy-tetrahydrodipicolinate synthase [Saccharopolyspora erythraea NRRL 2338]|uniref:Dihydrodipicolinate synthase n=2 Tax=Saccharopolyspora erythraea TaxID=1836 RepID=A4FIJ8_SACEN|nr:dihydrodipicolinate synthase family protein [Saccharopolyspora erythraea]EQD87895.1 dihydrodipicolinate synthase [Saccharopolyspora erythraea D]PFG97549.1 4-hydroxy-tetrahydrodipicolinate synthase [Saccharopolyspora erythraea NRRL 2338]QRK87719.1 dihydrodipicolinate synthase family protein [Saccharopolyspora erythraea]CAM03873.1 dihydrodipicolinate synthase [Saccharopolyspora erythraea NRRL 2338]
MSGQRTVITAVTTPFQPDGDLDLAAARQLYRFAGQHTGQLLVGGTTGEFPALTIDERMSLLDAALEVAGAEGVIAHVGTADAHNAAQLTRASVRAGARRLAALTPYYLPATPEELHAYFGAVRDAAGDAEIFAYLFPERTGLEVSPELCAELAAAHGLAGVKLSGAASRRVREHVAAAPEGFEVYSGNDRELGGVLAAGGEGTVSGCSAALPEPFLELAEAIRTGRDTGEVQQRVDRVVAALGPSIGRIKCAQRLRGLPAGESRMTVADPDAETESLIKDLVAENAR